jgi:hypothetical protein
MTALGDLVGGLGSGLVHGRAQSDRACVDVARLYREEELLQGIRTPRMILSEVTVEVRFVAAGVRDNKVEVLVTPDELAKARSEQISTLTLRFTEDDLEPAPVTPD